MKLRINKHFSIQLANVYLPDMLTFSDARTNIHPSVSDEYLINRIITETLRQLHKKLQIKIIVSKSDYCSYNFTDAEVICLYKFLLKHPIPAHLNFELSQRDALVHMLHKYLSSPAPINKIFILYR